MIHIRRACLDDIELLVEMRIEFLREAQSDACSREIEARTAIKQYLIDKLQKDEAAIWIAQIEGQIVGTGAVVFYHIIPSFHNLSGLQAYVLNMYTRPEWRNRSVATQILQQIIEYVKTTPTRYIALHTSSLGRPVYEKLGFKVSQDGMVLALKK